MPLGLREDFEDCNTKSGVASLAPALSRKWGSLKDNRTPLSKSVGHASRATSNVTLDSKKSEGVSLL